MTDLPRHFIVADLGFGDAGKGQTVDRLCRLQPVDLVVRYNGGCQAGHNVVAPDGRKHCFSQFGAGTLADVPTFLSRHMIVEPLSLAIEAQALVRDCSIWQPLRMITIEDAALVTTPYHWILNRARENQRSGSRHGSCGRGVGATTELALEGLALRVGDILNPHRHSRILMELHIRVTSLLRQIHSHADMPFMPSPVDVARSQREVIERVTVVGSDWLPQLLSTGVHTVFEGAQGVLLDQDYGFHPHTTWTDTTMRHADELLDEVGQQGFRIGVLRTYMVRHGAGPLPTEAPLGVPEPDNVTDPWQGSFRQGYFDAALYRYALGVLRISDPRWDPMADPNPVLTDYVHGLCLTHIDTALDHDLRIVNGYRLDGREYEVPLHYPTSLSQQQALGEEIMRTDWVVGGPVNDWPGVVSKQLGVPVVMTGRGPRIYSWRDITPPERDAFRRLYEFTPVLIPDRGTVDPRVYTTQTN